LEKRVINIPDYYCCILEYAEDFSRGKLEVVKFPVLKIEEDFECENMSFELKGIVYFQHLHYTAHVKGIYHPKLFPNKNFGWFYHDGIKDGIFEGKTVKGLLFENTPEYEIDIRNSQLKPYILIYKVYKSPEV